MSGSDAQNNVQAKPIAGQRRAVPRLRARLHEVIFGGWLAREAYLALLLLGGILIFAMSLAIMIMSPEALERSLPLLYAQRLSSTLNVECTNDVETR